MINKDIAGRKVIKAMSVGLAAVMATMSPMAALADTNGGEAPVYDVDETQNAEETAAISAESAADTSTVEADTAADNVVADITGENGAVKEYEKNDGALAQSAQVLAEKTEAGKENTAAVDVKGIVDADSAYDEAFSEANRIASKVDGEDIVKNLEIIDNANSDMDQINSDIENAGSIEAAQAAYEKAEEKAKEAQNAYDAASEAYAIIQSDYEAQLKVVEDKANAFNAAVTAASDSAAETQKELAAAVAAAKTLGERVNAAKNAADVAQKEADEAKAAAETAKTTAENLASQANQTAKEDQDKAEASAKTAKEDQDKADASAEKAAADKKAADEAVAADKKQADEAKTKADNAADAQYKLDDISGMIYRNYTNDNGTKDRFKAAALVQYYYTFGDGKKEGKSVASVECAKWDNNFGSLNSTYSKVTVTFDDGTTESQWVRCYKNKNYDTKAKKDSDSKTLLEDDVVAKWCDSYDSNTNAAAKREAAKAENKRVWEEAYKNAGSEALKTAEASAKTAKEDQDKADESKTNAESLNNDLSAKATAYDSAAAALEEASKKQAAYETLVGDYNAASEKVNTAKANVESLQEAIAALKNNNDENAVKSALSALESNLKLAQAKLEKAEENLTNINDKLEDAAKNLAETIDRLTPKPDNGGNYNGDDTSSDDGGATAVLPTVRPIPSGTETIATLTTAEEDPNAEVLGARRNTRSASKKAATGVEKVAETENEEIATTDSDVIVEKEKAPEVDKEKETVTIEDGEVALAGSLTEEEKQGMSWWWLLIVAALGATGVAMYRRHLAKKKVTK